MTGMFNQQGYNDYSQQQNRQYYPNYIVVQNINEAYNWAISPGSTLIFKDQDNMHIYIKSLSSPYDRPMFEVFTKEQEQSQTSEIDTLKEEMNRLKEAMKKLNSKITEKKVGD